MISWIFWFLQKLISSDFAWTWSGWRLWEGYEKEDIWCCHVFGDKSLESNPLPKWDLILFRGGDGFLGDAWLRTKFIYDARTLKKGERDLRNYEPAWVWFAPKMYMTQEFFFQFVKPQDFPETLYTIGEIWKFSFLYVKHEFVKFVSETGKTHEDINLHPLSSLIFDWQISGARNVFACKWRKSQQLTLIQENNTANIYQQFDLNKPFNHSSIKNHSLPFVYDGTSFSNVLLRKFLYATWKLTSGEER